MEQEIDQLDIIQDSGFSIRETEYISTLADTMCEFPEFLKLVPDHLNTDMVQFLQLMYKQCGSLLPFVEQSLYIASERNQDIRYLSLANIFSNAYKRYASKRHIYTE